MNETSKKFKEKNKQSNHQKLFSFTKGSYVFFLSCGVCISMNAKIMIEKLQRVTKEKKTQRSEHRQRHEEEVEMLRKKET